MNRSVQTMLATATLALSLNLSHAPTTVAQDNGPAWSVTAGGAIALRPTYEGSDAYEVVGFPIVAPRFGNTQDGRRSKVSFRGIDDVRFNLLDRDGFVAGPLAGYQFGRDERDGPLLTGLGDIDGGLIVGGFAGYHFDRLAFDVAYLQNVTSDQDTGFELRLAAQTQIPVSERMTMGLTLGTTYASEDYIDTYFGISNAQAAASGRAAYDPQAGFKDVYLGAKLKTHMTERITLHAGAKYKRLIGDAADSPLVATENQFFGSLGLSYRFDLGAR